MAQLNDHKKGVTQCGKIKIFVDGAENRINRLNLQKEMVSAVLHINRHTIELIKNTLLACSSMAAAQRTAE